MAGPVLLALPIRIDLPVGGALTLEDLSTGSPKIEVATTVSDVSEVWAAVHFPGLALPAPAPNATAPGAEFTQLSPGIATGSFLGLVPPPASHSCATSIPQFDNLAVTVIKRNADLSWDQEPRVTNFKCVCRTMTVVVPATACPWFAYADDDLVGPRGEPVAAHKPTRVRVPNGATQFAVTSVTGNWRHEPTNAGTSNAEGRTGSETGLLDALYTQYGPITAPSANLKVNTLVGLLQPSVGLAGQLFKIGMALGTTPLAGSRALSLGMWDGYGWNSTSNSGSVVVTIVWS